MRLLPSKMLANRQISYEFMNRQMVWHAFTVRGRSVASSIPSSHYLSCRSFCCWSFLSSGRARSGGHTNKSPQGCEISLYPPCSPHQRKRNPCMERSRFGRENTSPCRLTNARFALTRRRSTCRHSRLIQQASLQASLAQQNNIRASHPKTTTKARRRASQSHRPIVRPAVMSTVITACRRSCFALWMMGMTDGSACGARSSSVRARG